MHAFDFTLFAWIFWIALFLLCLAVLGIAFVVPCIKGMGAIGLGWLLATVAVACAGVVLGLGGLWLAT